MSKTAKITINAECTPKPEIQEVKIKAILIAEITLETPTAKLIEIFKIRGHWSSMWVTNKGDRISEFDVLKIFPEDLPVRLFEFPAKRDLDRELEEQIILEEF
jgi:hypothetical protein